MRIPILKRPFLLALATVLALLSNDARAALTPYLLKDVNTNTSSGLVLSWATSVPPWPVIDGVAYFKATDDHGTELWRSDGSPEGTWLVKDIDPGFQSSDPGYFVVWNNALWFTARVETNRVALFKSDGTSNGTVIIKDGFFGYPDMAAGQLTVVGETLFFTGNDGTTDRELWKSDGTPEGTVLVKDIVPGIGESLPNYFTAVGGIVVFRASDTNGTELWRTDGTADGTYSVKDIVPGPSSGFPGSFTLLGTNLLFAANNGTQLWKTDGTTSGTTLLYTVGSASTASSIQYMTLVGTQVFFQATFSGDAELWRSDGTSNGTRRVVDLLPTGSSYPNYFAALNGTLLFSADGGSDRHLWRSDGTAAGTWPVPGTNGAPVIGPIWLTTVGDRVYFNAFSSATGSELWVTDGTANHTYMVKDIAPGISSSTPLVGAALDGFTLLAALTPQNGTELWRTDGTESGTVLVKDINQRTGSANPYAFAQVGTNVFFAVDPAVLWKSDGTPAGTELVFPLQDEPMLSGQTIHNMTALGNSVVFAGSLKNSTNGTEPWISDGSPAGTHMLKDILPGAGSSSPREFQQIGNALLLAATGANGTELWRTDGTADGTVEVKDLRPGSGSSSPTGLTVYHGNLFFYASHGENLSGLWRSDGTATGTVLVVQFTNATFYGLTVGADQLFIFCTLGTNFVLCSSRGTPETTSSAGVLPPKLGPPTAGITFIGTPDGLLFAGGDSFTGMELWRSDGRSGGMGLVKDVRPGAFSSSPRNFFNNGRLTYFQADDNVHGIEIWVTDGTEAGTRLLKDINPGLASSASSLAAGRMAAVNGLVFFWAYEPAHGTELWMTDGTEEGTTIVTDLNPDNAQIFDSGASTAVLAGAGGRLYFTANNGSTGSELWALQVPRQPLLTVTRNNNGLLIQATGDPDLTHLLERSDDLRTWSPIATTPPSVQITQPLDRSNAFFRAHTRLIPVP